MGIFACSRALKVPTWATPRSKPPPNASPILGGTAAGVGNEITETDGWDEDCDHFLIIDRRKPTAPSACTTPPVTCTNGLPLGWMSILGARFHSLQFFV